MSKSGHKKHDGEKLDEVKDLEASGAAQQDTDSERAREKTGDYNELWDKYLRLCAEFDNARKRWERDRTELVRYAHYSLIQDLLVIVDELEHALRAIKEHGNHEQIHAGVEMTYKNLVVILKKNGLSPIEAKGKKFDPHLHEIVGQKEDADCEEHLVVEEVQKGYMLADRLLRTSKVVISVKKKPEAAPEPAVDSVQLDSADVNEARPEKEIEENN